MQKTNDHYYYLGISLLILLGDISYILYSIYSHQISMGIDFDNYSRMRIYYQNTHDIIKTILFGLHTKYFMTSLYYLLFENNILASIILVIISYIAWLYLAFTVIWLIKNSFLRKLLFIIIVSTSLNPNIMFYNKVLTSDSLSISFNIIILASLLSYMQDNLTYKSILIILSSLISSLIRDTNALLIPFILLIMFYKNKFHKLTYITYGFSFLFCFISILIMSKYTKYIVYQSVTNNVYNRILPNPDRKNYFIKAGMPDNGALNRCIGKKAWNCYSGQQSQDWINNNGQKTYIKWLIISLPERIYELIYKSPELIHDTSIIYSYNDNPIIIKIISRLIPIGNFRWIYILILYCIYHFIFYNKIYLNKFINAIIYILILTLPNYFICYYGDTDQIPRHILVPIIFIETLLFIITIYIIDSIHVSNKSITLTRSNIK